MVCVGTLGICGNLLTLAVLRKSKKTKFNELLIFLSLIDSSLIVFFVLNSVCTVLSQQVAMMLLIVVAILISMIVNILLARIFSRSGSA